MVIWYKKYTGFLLYTGILRETVLFLKSIIQIRMEQDLRSCPQHANAEACTKMLLPVKDALEILSGKWKMQIIVSLSFGRKRFKQMQREIPGITAKMLTKELRDLEMNELAARYVYDTAPVSVEYELTNYGKSLNPVIRELHQWGLKHRKRIIARPGRASKN